MKYLFLILLSIPAWGDCKQDTVSDLADFLKNPLCNENNLKIDQATMKNVMLGIFKYRDYIKEKLSSKDFNVKAQENHYGFALGMIQGACEHKVTEACKYYKKSDMDEFQVASKKDDASQELKSYLDYACPLLKQQAKAQVDLDKEKKIVAMTGVGDKKILHESAETILWIDGLLDKNNNRENYKKNTGRPLTVAECK